ncbi:two-component sensor histidine kinase, partial [Actinomyces oris]
MTSLLPTRTVTIGTRVMWAIVLVAGIALVMCGAIVWALGHSSVSADATNRLEHSRDRIRQLAADRQDPSSGQPLEDVSAVLRTHIQRTAEGRGEAELGFVGTDAGTELTWVSSDNVSFRPEEDKELLTRVTAQASASESVIETVRTPTSSYRVLVVPLQGGSQRGALVHVIDLKVAESQLRRTMAFYAA